MELRLEGPDKDQIIAKLMSTLEKYEGEDAFVNVNTHKKETEPNLAKRVLVEVRKEMANGSKSYAPV